MGRLETNLGGEWLRTLGGAVKRPAFRVEAIAFSIILAGMLFSIACTPNKRIVESAQTPEPIREVGTPQVTGFEADLQSMRNADFKFILVFRRKDGAPMDAEDKYVINANTPPDVNRRRLTEDGKVVLIGSNFPFLPGSIDNLTSRFIMEDYSKADAGPIEVDRYANSNANANVNQNANANQRANAAGKSSK